MNFCWLIYCDKYYSSHVAVVEKSRAQAVSVKKSENRLHELTNRMIMRIESFYTYPHWFRLRWFGVVVERAARRLNLHYIGYSGRTSSVFHMYRSKRSVWPSCPEVLSFELRYWRSEARKRKMQDIHASLKLTHGKLVRYFRQPFFVMRIEKAIC